MSISKKGEESEKKCPCLGKDLLEDKKFDPLRNSWRLWDNAGIERSQRIAKA
jgi:hypothetical protein